MIMDAQQRPDPQTIAQHLDRITGRWHELDEPCELEIRAINKEIGRTLIGRFKPTEISDAAQWCADLNKTRNIYAVVNPIRPTAARTGASDSDVIAATWCWIDCDEAPAAEHARNFVGPKHSFAVITGTTPHTRPHVYWELFDWQRDLAAWRGLQERLAAHFASDPTVVNPSRIMRVAGTVTFPDAGKRARGYVSELTQWKPRPGIAPTSFDILSGLFPARPAAPAGGLAIDTGTRSAPGLSLDRDAAFSAALRGEEWHNNMVRVVASLVANGITDAEIHAITDRLTLDGYTVDQTRREVQQAIDGARRKGWDQNDYARPEAVSLPDFHRKRESATSSQIEWFDDIEPALGDDYIIKGVISRGAMSVVYGPSNSGKTFYALDMAYHVAIGASWRGHRVKGGGVLYLAAEGGRGLINRVAALRKEHGVCDVPLAVRRGGLDLLKSTADLDAIGKMAWEVHQRAPIALIVVDTLSRVIAGGDENSAADMTAFIRNIDRLREGIGCHIMIVHHTGKDTARGARGHSSLRAATDTEIEVSNEDGNRAAVVTKQRDYQGGEVFAFSLKPVELGHDGDGDEVSSCVVSVEAETTRWNPTKKERVVWDALMEFTAHYGTPTPRGTGWPEGGQFKMVDGIAFREFAQGRFSDANPRRSFRDAMDRLWTAGRVGVNGGKIWAIHQHGQGGQSADTNHTVHFADTAAGRTDTDTPL